MPHVTGPLCRTILLTLILLTAHADAAWADSDPDTAKEAEASAAGIEALRETLQQGEREAGPDSPTLIPLLNQLAMAELDAGEKEYAAARLERVVDLIRQSEGHYTGSLMTPLLSLGAIYMEGGQYERAISRLRYAQHLTHRRDGVYSLEQLDLIEQLALAFFAQRDTDEAGREKRFAYNLSRRVHGEDSIEHVPGMLRYATWYRLIGEDRRARELYFRAIDMLEQAHGADHYSLIEPLIQLSATASRRGYYAGEREAALLRADEILNRQEGVDPGDKAASAVRLGDFYTLMRRPGDAATHYARAWQDLAEDEIPKYSPDAIFARPVVLNFPHSFIPDQSRGLLIPDREIEVTYEFEVGADGKVSNVEVVRHTGPTTLNRSLRKLAFTLQYRPRIVDGQPVSTERVRVTEKLLVGSPLSRGETMKRLARELSEIRRLLWTKGLTAEQINKKKRRRPRLGG